MYNNDEQKRQRMLQRIKNMRMMDKYRHDQRDYNERLQTVGDKILGGIKTAKGVYEDLSGVTKAKDLMNKFNTPKMPSADFASKVGATNTLSSIKPPSFQAPTANLGVNTSLPTQTPALQTGELASKIGAGSKIAGSASQASGALQGVGKAMPVVGTALGLASAGNNFAKGNHVDGAMDLAKTGAMFIPGVGWAVAGAIQIAQMLKGMKAKKDAKAMANAEKASQKEQQQSLTNMSANKQDMAQIQAENQQAMADQIQKNNMDSNSTATTGDLYGEGTNYPTIQQPLIKSPELKTPENVLPPLEMPNDYQAENNPEMPEIPETTTPAPEEEQGAGFAKGSDSGKFNFVNGIKDFVEGYKDNSQTSFSQGDLAKRFQQPEVVATQLPDGTFDVKADEIKKGMMARLGEMMGTGQRIASHPLTQAGIAGLVSKMAGGEADDIAKAMYEYGTKKAEADRYYQMTTGKTDRPFLNTYGADDYKTKVAQDKIAQEQANWQKEHDWKVAKDARDFEIEKQKADAMAKYYANGGARANSADRLAWEMQKYRDQQQKKLLEAKWQSDLKNADEMSDYGQVADGKNWLGKDKMRPRKKAEYIKEINDDYYRQLQAMVNGGNYEEEDPLGVL